MDELLNPLTEVSRVSDIYIIYMHLFGGSGLLRKSSNSWQVGKVAWMSRWKLGSMVSKWVKTPIYIPKN